MRLDPDEFGKLLSTVLSPSHAIQTPELLKGRDRQLDEIKKAWYTPGRQIFIHGFRGVGKTSLAHTIAFQHQSADSSPILLSCTENVTFFGIMHDMFAKGFKVDPRELKRTRTTGIGVQLGKLSSEMREAVEIGKAPVPTSLNQSVELAEFLANTHSIAPVVVIDEFDLLTDKAEQAMFANFIKQIGDQRLNIRFIFCGIGDSIDTLLKSHQSVYRYFHTVKLDRLDYEPRYEIIMTAAQTLKIEVDETTKIRIAKVSDGFPHFIHLVCEKLFWIAYEDENANMRVSGDHYERAIAKAVGAIEPYLKTPYEKATRKYTNANEEILWAVADNHELQRSSSKIFESYKRIMRDRNKEPLTRQKFNARMNNMKQKAYGEVLLGTRQGWYEFQEKMLRGYARLRASQEGIELDIEHPLQAKRISRTYLS